ncbi:NAD-dependent epimerase/dehydratase family protein [Vulgatibacter incomptus]|uniref:UDP-glucose 4-epimerase n=1 Tax=Vulgatibacter incomptus TaxID=1391653 RepID=A0A0K1PA62_9BACT|nr:NAD-dependent epimerase/dehydratase family protein [Vulgatibacter incomptus]AKU90392.1 UDP-glucose 4-epimerase [Vulgatibacter incomptus]
MAKERETTPRKETQAPPRVVAVVGSQSALGRGLVARLCVHPSIERIVAIDLRPPETILPKVHFQRLDLTRPSADQEIADILLVEEVDTLVHLAYFGAPVPDAAYAHELEVIGTLHVLTAATAAKLGRLVVRSSTAVYGAHPKNPSLLREEHRVRGAPRSGFVSDKLEAERQVREYAADHPEVAVSILRLAPILGPSVHNVFQRYLQRTVAPTLAGFDPLMQAIHVDDAVEALEAAVFKAPRGIFNVAGRGVIPISAALRLCGTKALPMPYRLAETLLQSARGAGFGIALPAAMLDYLRYPFVTDSSRFEREVGFVPRHTTRDAVLAMASSETRSGRE